MSEVDTSNVRQSANCGQITGFARDQAVIERARVEITVEVKKETGFADNPHIQDERIESETYFERKAALYATVEGVGSNKSIDGPITVDIDHLVSDAGMSLDESLW